jgi:hypothetical protein
MVKPFDKKGGNMCMNKICCENGVFFVNDLIKGAILHLTCIVLKSIYVA